MKVAILGCGYIGTALAINLKGKGHVVTTTTRSPDNIPYLQSISDHAMIVQGNQIQALENLLRHQEALVMTVAADSSSNYEETYLKTAQAISTVINNHASLSKIIYTSSTSIYGDHQGNSVDETTPPHAKFPTSQILISTEDTLMALTSNERDVCILRLGEIYGPEREIASRLKRMEGIPFPGDGSHLTNLIHRDDVVRAIEFALEKPLRGIYNLCNDLHIPRREFYRQICEQENLPPVKWDPSKPTLHSSNKRVSSAKIKAAGFEFRSR
jgi:nucleoside-diphosphate-sugar epimerase